MDAKTRRMIAFLDAQGGAKKVADRCGKRPDIFYNIINKEMFPSAATLELIGSEFGNAFDINWIIKGVNGGEPVTYAVSSSDLEKEMEELKRDMKDLATSNEFLKRNLLLRLSEKEQALVNFKERKRHCTARQINVDRNMNKATLSVTLGA
jgi:hypothetical protein